ncbi:MAG: hypothetical protein ACTSW1_12985 [Candidatus Hodarchaeales archaeon]
MRKRNFSVVLALTVMLVSMFPLGSMNATLNHEGHFAVNEGDRFEFVWTSLKDSDGNNITDGSYSYPDAPSSKISQGDHFYIDIDTINTSMMGPSIYGNFTFADGSETGTVALMGYVKAMNSTSYNWTYWHDYYTGKNYTVTNNTEYFQYESGTSGDANYMRFRWDISDGVMLEWEMKGMWIQMMGFGTLSELLITRYESTTDYGVSVGDKIWLQWAVLKDADGEVISDDSYAYPDAPESNISQGDVFYIEITTINSSFMGTVAYGKFVFGDVSSPEVMLMGYIKSREWSHYQLYYAKKGYTVINNATHFGYQSGSEMGGPLLKMVWLKSTGTVVEFWLKGFWIQMMGFGTASEIKLVATTEPKKSPGFESLFLLIALVGIAAMASRKRR